MNKRLLTFLCLLGSLASLSAQSFRIDADLVSHYMWRGINCGGLSLQPSLTFEVKGFSITAWGSTEFRTEFNEVDLSIQYEYKGLYIRLLDVFCQENDKQFRYFNFKSKETNHSVELGVRYRICDKVPLTFAWYTNLFGKDYLDNGKRAWSTYIEASYPFDVKFMEIKPEVGITPWNGKYARQFNVVNIGVQGLKSFRITDKVHIPVWVKFTVNPYREKAYVSFGTGVRIH